MTHPNRLVKVPDIGALVEEIGGIIGQDQVGRLELPRKQQDAGRKRLAGAVELPEVKAVDERLRLYWQGGDGLIYEATLVGLDTERGYAVVTGVDPKRRRNAYKDGMRESYKVWKGLNGPWF